MTRDEERVVLQRVKQRYLYAAVNVESLLERSMLVTRMSLYSLRLLINLCLNQ